MEKATHTIRFATLQSTSAKVSDALIGYGNAAPGQVAELIASTASCRTPALALDVPSGVDATSVQTPGVFVSPRWTLTLALPKTGLLPRLTGELYLGDIGIPDQVYRLIGIGYVSPSGTFMGLAQKR